MVRSMVLAIPSVKGFTSFLSGMWSLFLRTDSYLACCGHRVYRSTHFGWICREDAKHCGWICGEDAKHCGRMFEARFTLAYYNC